MAPVLRNPPFAPLFQMPLLADGIRIHGEKLTEQLKPLHDRLVSCFKELRVKVEKLCGVITLVRRHLLLTLGCFVNPLCLEWDRRADEKLPVDWEGPPSCPIS